MAYKEVLESMSRDATKFCTHGYIYPMYGEKITFISSYRKKGGNSRISISKKPNKLSRSSSGWVCASAKALAVSIRKYIHSVHVVLSLETLSYVVKIASVVSETRV